MTYFSELIDHDGQHITLDDRAGTYEMHQRSAAGIAERHDDIRDISLLYDVLKYEAHLADDDALDDAIEAKRDAIVESGHFDDDLRTRMFDTILGDDDVFVLIDDGDFTLVHLDGLDVDDAMSKDEVISHGVDCADMMSDSLTHYDVHTSVMFHGAVFHYEHRPAHGICSERIVLSDGHGQWESIRIW